MKRRGLLIGRAVRAGCLALGVVVSSSITLADPIRMVTGGSVYTGNYDTGYAQGLTRLFTTFTFTATLAGFADPSRTGAPLFSTDLMGRGVTRVAFSNYPPESGIRVLQLDYHVDDLAAAPEPGSLLLFGSGAAWCAARWRTRRHGGR